MSPFEMYLGHVHMWNLHCQRGGKIQIHAIPVLVLFGQPFSSGNVLVVVFLKEQFRLEQTVRNSLQVCSSLQVPEVQE